MNHFKHILQATSCHDLIEAGRPLIEDLFPHELQHFADSVCDSWQAISDLKHLPIGTDTGCVLSTRLRQLIPVSKGCLKKFLSAMMSLAPHSMQVERIVSHYNNIRSSHRLSMSLDTVTDHLLALNGVGTAHFDPRPCVAKFLSDKERRTGHLIRTSTSPDFTQKSFFATMVPYEQLWLTVMALNNTSRCYSYLLNFIIMNNDCTCIFIVI